MESLSTEQGSGYHPDTDLKHRGEVIELRLPHESPTTIVEDAVVPSIALARSPDEPVAPVRIDSTADGERGEKDEDWNGRTVAHDADLIQTTPYHDPAKT
jgi:hypothetical protein